MTMCTFCDREMNDNISCDIAPYRIGGDVLQPIPWGDERSCSSVHTDHPCQGCGTPPGSVHHIGCDYEQCPACDGQINICPCVDDDDPVDDYLDDDPYDDEDDEEEEVPAAAVLPRPTSAAVAAAVWPRRHGTRARCTVHRLPRHYRT
jgi:hypothetical protein